MSDPLYQLSEVAFSVGGRTILHPLHLAIAPGRVVGIVGANGSGKSTLVKLLARQHAPTQGTVRLLGRAAGGYGSRAFARLVAYMPQFTPPAEGLTVRELAALGRFPWHGPLGRFSAGDRARVELALAQADLLSLADRPVDTLSGGERQRSWLAMMLAQDTRCLLLDEPTSALDIAHQVEMLALVKRLSRDRGIGVVVVLHDINMAARTCDEILALRGGRVVARGTPDAIVREGTLGEIYGLRLGVLPHPVTGAPLSYVP